MQWSTVYAGGSRPVERGKLAAEESRNIQYNIVLLLVICSTDLVVVALLAINGFDLI
jgi:hypothetical protein